MKAGWLETGPETGGEVIATVLFGFRGETAWH
jgi:hypothetical protein